MKIITARLIYMKFCIKLLTEIISEKTIFVLKNQMYLCTLCVYQRPYAHFLHNVPVAIHKIYIINFHY